MKKIISSILVAGTLSSVSSAATISINFIQGPANNSNSQNIAAANTAGVEAASNWNNLSGASTGEANLQADIVGLVL